MLVAKVLSACSMQSALAVYSARSPAPATSAQADQVDTPLATRLRHEADPDVAEMSANASDMSCNDACAAERKLSEKEVALETSETIQALSLQTD